MAVHRCVSIPVGWRLAVISSAAALLSFGGAPARALVEESLAIPMRDGTILAATVFRPDETGAWPLVLIRTPYDKSSYDPQDSFVQETINHGYSLAVQDTRGRFASQGTDSTFWTDGWGVNQDGYDTIEWLAVQSWCDGNIGMFGGSARGIVQLLAAGALPPHLKACFVQVACDDFYQQAFFQGGAFRKRMVEGWMQEQGSSYMVPFFTSHPTRDAFWDYLDLETRAQDVAIPMFHMGGHYDIFGEGAIDAFRSLHLTGAPGARGRQRLVMGPWQHRGLGMDGQEQGELIYPANSLYDYRGMRWRWFDRWLKGILNGVDTEPAVEFYLMGDVDRPFSVGNRWVSVDAWPPATDPVPFYLHPGGLLSPDPPLLPGAHSGFTYDPDDPIPTLGGRNLNMAAGPHDQRPLHSRPDQLIFTSPVLAQPLQVVGKVEATLWAGSSALDTDWTVKLVDVYPDGREMLVTDGVLRARFRDGFSTEHLLEPGSIHAFTVDLWSTALAFDVGHRIQVVVSSSNFPRFDANPNDGLPFNSLHNPIVAANEIHFSPERPSRVVLPVYPTLVATPDPDPVEPGWRLSGARVPGSRFDVVLELDRPRSLDIAVFSTGGRVVRLLHEGALPPGRNALVWDGRTATGAPAGPGVYHLRVADRRRGVAAVEKMVVIR